MNENVTNMGRRGRERHCIMTGTIHFATALTITGTNSTYQLGETYGIRCSTEVPVQSIQWLDGSSGVVRQGTSVQELVLNLTIAASHNNSRYTCEVRQGTFVTSKQIIIRTGRKINKELIMGSNARILCIAPLMVSLSGSGGPRTAGENVNYTLTCQVTGGGITTPTYRWFKNNSLLTGKRSVTLSFSTLSETDSGIYICEGTRNSNSTTSESVTLTVAGKFSAAIKLSISHFLLHVHCCSTRIVCCRKS